MSNDIDIVVKATDEASAIASKSFSNLSNKVDETSSSFDRAGEAADQLDTKAMGFRDTMTGVQDTTAGVGQIMKGDLFDGFLTLGAGVGDLASGFYNLIIPMTKTIATTTAHTAVTIAHGIASGAVRTATLAWTAAQWLLNIAMDASGGPIGLIIIGIIALVAAIVWIATKTTWFQSIWEVTWSVLKAIGAWFAGPFAHFFTTAYHIIMDGIDVAGRWVRSKFDALVGFVTGIPGRISSAASGMWDGVKNAFKGAINWIIGRWNNLHFSIPSFEVFGFHTPGFTLNMPNIPYLARGGIIPATPGGRLILAGEGGEDEAVIPLSALSGNGRGGRMTMQITGNADSAFVSVFKMLVRTNQIRMFDSTGALIVLE